MTSDTNPEQAGTTRDASLAAAIDHTLLKPEASREDILRICSEAAEYGFKSVCVNPIWVGTVHNALKGSGVLTCSVIGFPLGAATTDVKVYEARAAIMDGADELDMVLNIAAARAQDQEALVEDISAVAEVAAEAGATLKVIIEAALLDDAQKVLACRCAAEAGADFVKTSTGFNGPGATVEDVALIHRTVPGLGVKASGGIRTREDAEAMFAAGATRIGASSGMAIVDGRSGSSAY